MDEDLLLVKVNKLINNTISNIYIIDALEDKVYILDYSILNNLVVRKKVSYNDFLTIITQYVHKDDLKDYLSLISFTKIEDFYDSGIFSQSIKYRKLNDNSEYILNENKVIYFTFNNRKLMLLMSYECSNDIPINQDLIEELENKLAEVNNKIKYENDSISDVILKINELFDNSNIDFTKKSEAKSYINSLFINVLSDYPELSNTINEKINTNKLGLPTLLIVDDSSIIRNSLKRIFKEVYNIEFAKNGEEAIKIIEENSAKKKNHEKYNDIVGILLDLVMPEYDGFYVLEYLKKHNILNKIPVSIISGDESIETRKKVYKYNIVDVLTKPFNTDIIRRRMTKFINLYKTSIDLNNIIEFQKEELEDINAPSIENIKIIINKIVSNIINTKESNNLKKVVRIVSLNLKNLYPDYNLDNDYIDYIVESSPLYNIGAIAYPNDLVITSKTIKEEIDFGLSIIDNYIDDEREHNIASNIIKFSCEMYNGSGYPNGIKGSLIPIEAQIVNLMVRINSNSKNISKIIKTIIDNERDKYNNDLLDVLERSKNEIKKVYE